MSRQGCPSTTLGTNGGLLILCALLGATPAWSAPADPVRSGTRILKQMLEVDWLALNGAEQTTHAVVRNDGAVTSRLVFNVTSRVWAPGLAQVVLRFREPRSVTGAGILLVQHDDADDERFIFLPEDKRVRRIPGAQRNQNFLGLDFTYADLDRRDLRQGTAKLLGTEDVSGSPCSHLDVTTLEGGPYSHIEVWVAKDTRLPLKWRFFGQDKKLLKTFEAQEVRRVSQHWYITRSLMTNVVTHHSTEMVIDHVAPLEDATPEQFTPRELERL